MTTVYKFQSGLEADADQSTLSYNIGFKEGFKAGLEAAKQSIAKMIEEENKKE